MPEGDTVHLAAHRLDAALRGSALTSTDFRVPRHASVDLAGREVDSVEAFGKHMFVRIAGETTIHSHLKMEGSWHLYRPGERWKGPAFQVRAILETERWVAVGFRLGRLDVLASNDEARFVGHLGPDPLRPDWDAAEASRRLSALGDSPLSLALLDQRAIAGLGNVYKSEICFLSGLNPWLPVKEISDLDAVVRLSKRLMDANRARGDQMTTGIDRPGEKQWVYGRGGQPCRRCGTRIVWRRESDERATYWCPRCQRTSDAVGKYAGMPYSGSTQTRT